MTAADNLARWREAERVATKGPWESRHERDEEGDWSGADIVHTYSNERVIWPNQVLATADLSPEDADFIATSREAMPALLAFVQSALVLADGWERKALAAEESANARGGLGDEPFLREHARTLHRRVSEVRSLAEHRLATTAGVAK